MRVCLAVCVVLLSSAVARAQTGSGDPWTGQVTGLVSNVGTIKADVTATKLNTANTAAALEDLALAVSNLQTSVTALNTHVELGVYWLQILGWWFPIWLGYRLWADISGRPIDLGAGRAG